MTVSGVASEGVKKASVPFQAALWGRLFSTTIIIGYIYTFLEWIFFVTKPSFMDTMSTVDKVRVFWLAGLFFALVSVVLPLLFAGLDLALKFLRSSRIFLYAATLVPAGVLAVLSLLLIDNFTYTLFKFGIVSTGGVARALYAVVFLGLLALIYRWALGFLGFRGAHQKNRKLERALLFLALGLLALSAIVALTRLEWLAGRGAGLDLGTAARRPNIILLGSDGLNAGNLSAYGYARDTTPNMRNLVESSLLAENAFPNAGTSAGSTISILTSKLPTQTRVLYSPDILRGSDAYQHLPGILQREGYRTVEIGEPVFVDSYAVNMQDGFDMVNGRTTQRGVFRWLRLLGANDFTYFVAQLIERASDRLLHIFYIRTMVNPYSLVTQVTSQMDDQQRIAQLISLITQSDAPLFAHVHLMGTHGAKFDPIHKVFSQGKTQDGDWMTDFYDDAILDYDAYVGQVVDALDKAGKLDNTVLIFFTDHAERYYTHVRIPLIFHFPGGEFAGRIRHNVQNLDIAPTILDYLGLSQPEWMMGQSLLRGEPPAERLIFSAYVSYVTGVENVWQIDASKVKPPFYQFGKIVVLDCQRWYAVNLYTLQGFSGEIQDHTSPCDASGLFTADQARAALYERLTQDGFDISTLPKDLVFPP